MFGPGQGRGRTGGSKNTPIPWERRSSRDLCEMGSTGYSWPTAAGHVPSSCRSSTARTCTESYGDCAAAQAGLKNDFTAQHWRSAARHVSIFCEIAAKNAKKKRENGLKSSFYRTSFKL